VFLVRVKETLSKLSGESIKCVAISLEDIEVVLIQLSILISWNDVRMFLTLSALSILHLWKYELKYWMSCASIAGDMVPGVRTGAVLCPSWNLTVAMLGRDVEDCIEDTDIVKLSSSEDSDREGVGRLGTGVEAVVEEGGEIFLSLWLLRGARI
jgi:hypothetical protein